MKPTVLQGAGRQELFVTTPYNFTAAPNQNNSEKVLFYSGQSVASKLLLSGSIPPEKKDQTDYKFQLLWRV